MPADPKPAPKPPPPATSVREVTTEIQRNDAAQKATAVQHAKLTSTRARLDNSQRIAGIGDWEYDFPSKRLLWSDEIYQILGITRKEFPPDSETFYRQVHPDDLARVLREKKTAAQGLRRVDFDHRIIRPNGEIRHVHQVTGMTFDVHGQPAQESGTIQDITERKVAENALRESEERYRLMFDRNPSPMWVFDSQTLEFLAVNDAALALYGYSREEFLRLNAKDIRPVEAVPEFLRRNAVAPFEFRGVERSQHRKKDGTIFPVDIIAHGIDFGGRSARLVLALDMTVPDRAVAALRESELRFRALSESAPLGIFECDATGGCIYHNPALSVLTGRSLQENLGPGWKHSVHPDDRISMTRSWARAVVKGRTWDQEQRLLRPDGSVRWVHTLVAPAKDSEGRTTGFVGTVEDITRRRAAETALQRQQAELRVLFDLMPAMIWFKDTKNRILRVNQHAADAAGKTVDEIEGKSSEEIYPLMAAQFYADDLAVIQSGVARLGIVETISGPSGKTLWIQTDKVPYRDKDGKMIGIIVMAQDITARKVAEVALRESEERFKFVARAVSDAIWDWDIAAGTVWWNEGYFTAFGYAVGEIPPSYDSWTSRIHFEDRQRVVDSIQAAIASDATTWGCEYRFQRRDQSYAYVRDSGYILRTNAGLAIRMVGGLRDLTEQKRMEAQFLRAQRMDSIGTLAGGIAHDLNNVLAPILMSIELLKLDPGNDPARARMLDTIYTSCRRGADLVRQVLSFARGMDGERVVIRLRHLIDDLQGMIGETFPRNIRIETEVPNDIWPIKGDPTQLHQVMLNLAVNARDAMPRGGTLRIAVSNVDFDSQYVGTGRETQSGPHVLLTVSDEGMGIPPETRDRIFEPFFTTKELGKGTGLGLATVHAIVKSHGGFITVESEVGQGTKFIVHLPADPALRSSVTQHPFAPVELPRGGNELILVVDDEPSIREITQQTLEAYGYRVITASDGADAVAIYAMQSAQISAVLTDMMMPIMDGAATIKVILRINPSARIIAASGIDSKDAVTKAGIAGVKHFLAKPYTAETLLRLMREVMESPAGSPHH